MSIWNQPQLKPLEPEEESRHQPLDSPPPIHESAPAAVGLCDPMGTTARELRCPRCATSTTETRCQQCDLDLVTGNDPHQHRHAAVGDVDRVPADVWIGEERAHCGGEGAHRRARSPSP